MGKGRSSWHLKHRGKSKLGWLGVESHQNGFRAYVNFRRKKVRSVVLPTAEVASKLRDLMALKVYGKSAQLNWLDADLNAGELADRRNALEKHVAYVAGLSPDIEP